MADMDRRLPQTCGSSWPDGRRRLAMVAATTASALGGGAVCGGGGGKKAAAASALDAAAAVIDREVGRRHARAGVKEAIMKLHNRSGTKSLGDDHLPVNQSKLGAKFTGSTKFMPSLRYLLETVFGLNFP